jgi:hypothetical protein
MLMKLDDAEWDLLAHVPEKYGQLPSDVQRALWGIQRQGVVEDRLIPIELPAQTVFELRLTEKGRRALAERSRA